MTTWPYLSFIFRSLFSVSQKHWVVLRQHERRESFALFSSMHLFLQENIKANLMFAVWRKRNSLCSYRTFNACEFCNNLYIFYLCFVLLIFASTVLPLIAGYLDGFWKEVLLISLSVVIVKIVQLFEPITISKVGAKTSSVTSHGTFHDSSATPKELLLVN